MPKLKTQSARNSLAASAAVPQVLDLTAPAPAAPPRRLVHSVPETCEILGVSHATMYAIFGRGQLVPRKILGKTVVTDADSQIFVAGLARAPVRVRPAESDAA